MTVVRKKGGAALTARKKGGTALIPRVYGEDAGGGFNQPVTHGDQLTINDVGPWALQEVTKGTEAYQSVSGPGRGYFRFDTPDEFAPTGAWPSSANDSNPATLNDSALHGGVVTGSPVTIDGYSIPVGTRIVQFRDFPDGYDFYAQGTALKVLFRGCRFRFSSGVGGAGLFNDNGASATQQIMLHYCDTGLTGRDVAANAAGLMHVKYLGGSYHRVHRTHSTFSSTFFQPNVVGCSFVENWMDDFVFYYGESGESGGFGSDVFHMNGISSEGGQSVLTILRNHILAPSPDGATGANGFTAAGQTGYGTQSGQTGYVAGTNPGRVVPQTDCIALFAISSSNVGASPGAILIQDNYLGGSGVVIYAGNADSGAQNIHVIGNKITTKWWTNGGNYGAITDVPAWGSNGNLQSGNVWADDYGTGGNGATALADRQYPAGSGPRAGSSFIGG